MGHERIREIPVGSLGLGVAVATGLGVTAGVGTGAELQRVPLSTLRNTDAVRPLVSVAIIE